MKELHMTISGRVQGVFFRDFVRTHATKLGLTGFVRNKNDGTVEIVTQGERKSLDELQEFCAKGPSSAHVTHLEKEWKESTNQYEKFTIE